MCILKNKIITRWGRGESFKVYHIGQKGPNPYYSPFLPCILILIKNDYILDYYNFKFHHNHP